MRGLFVVLGIGVLKGIYTRLFLKHPSRRNIVKPEAAAQVRLTTEGAGQNYDYAWPKRGENSQEKDHQ